MKRPEARKLENGILLTLFAIFIIANIAISGVLDTLGVIIFIALALLVLTGITAFSKRVGR